MVKLAPITNMPVSLPGGVGTSHSIPTHSQNAPLSPLPMEPLDLATLNIITVMTFLTLQFKNGETFLNIPFKKEHFMLHQYIASSASYSVLITWNCRSLTHYIKKA